MDDVTAKTLVESARSALRSVADPAKAEPMRAYMKSTMPFLGVQKPARVRAQRPIFDAVELDRPADLFAAVEALWEAAEYREERYVALDLLDHRRFRALIDHRAVRLLEKLIVEGAWWDLVDACSGPTRHALEKSPKEMKAVLRSWAEHPDLWLRRSAMIAQLGRRERTDFGLLRELVETALSTPGIESELSDRDARFFLHKAAGWALRDYAWRAPDTVDAYLKATELPALTRREAAKNLDRARAKLEQSGR